MNVIEHLVLFARLKRSLILQALRSMEAQDLGVLVEILKEDLGRPNLQVNVEELADLIWAAVGGGSGPRESYRRGRDPRRGSRLEKLKASHEIALKPRAQAEGEYRLPGT